MITEITGLQKLQLQMFTGLQKLNDYRSYGTTVDLLGQYS